MTTPLLIGLSADVVLAALSAPSHTGLRLLALAAGILAVGLGVLLHELGHSFVAIREGLSVARIDVWILGGVAHLRGQARTPGGSAQIALAGPLVSVVLGVAGLLLAGALELVGASALLSAGAFWFGLSTVFLAVFNLLPAAPLDGGRVLAAVLWKVRGGRRRGEVTAARAGQGLGVALGLLGVLSLVNGTGGIWYLVLGFFVLQSATGEVLRASAMLGLEGVRVGDVAERRVRTVPGTTTAGEVVAAPEEVVLVSDGGESVGLTLAARLSSLHPDALVSSVVWPISDLPSVEAATDLTDALEKVGSSNVGMVVVTEDGAVVGVVTAGRINSEVARRRGQDTRRAGRVAN